MTGSSVAQQIIVGVDTHKDVHVAAAIDVHCSPSRTPLRRHVGEGLQ